jgi:hypothetical protein
MWTSLKIKQSKNFPMKYRSHDYQRAILRGTVMEIFRESSTVQAFYFYSKISFEFLYVATVIHREIHFCKREITNREDFCRLLGNGTITSAASFVAPSCDLQIFATYFDNKQLWST